MIIGCGTVVFRQHPLEKALYAIRKAGFEYCETQGVGPWCQHVDVRRTDPVAFAEQVRAAGFKGVTALWMPDGTLIASEKSVESAILSLRWAQAAGIPVVNTGDGHKPEGMDTAEAFARLGDRLGRILAATEGCGVKLAIEPHGTFSLTAEGLLKILSLAPAKRLGVNYDAANIKRACYVESSASGSVWKNAGDGDTETAVLAAVLGRTVHFHAKDLGEANTCVALGEGTVDLRGCIALLRSAGYAGAVSLETEGDQSYEHACLLAKKSFGYLQNELNFRDGESQ